VQKTVYILLMIVGVIAASLFAAHIPPYWGLFALASLVILMGVVGLHRLRRNQLRQNHQRQQVRSSLLEPFVGLQQMVERLLSGNHPQPNLPDGVELEERFREYFLQIENVRELLRMRLGTTRFIDFSTTLARAERLINRAVSATIDGYPDEALLSLREAEPFLKETVKILNDLQ